METLGSRLRNLRKRNNVMAKTMAEVLRVTPRNYQRYERDEVDMPVSKLSLFADYFNMSADYLLGRSVNPQRL